MRVRVRVRVCVCVLGQLTIKNRFYVFLFCHQRKKTHCFQVAHFLINLSGNNDYGNLNPAGDGREKVGKIRLFSVFPVQCSHVGCELTAVYIRGHIIAQSPVVLLILRRR